MTIPCFHKPSWFYGCFDVVVTRRHGRRAYMGLPVLHEAADGMLALRSHVHVQ